MHLKLVKCFRSVYEIITLLQNETKVDSSASCRGEGGGIFLNIVLPYIYRKYVAYFLLLMCIYIQLKCVLSWYGRGGGS